MAGAGYKLFATGDVLTASDVNTYLMQQTVMVFADAAARTTALSGVVAEGMLSYLKDTNAVEVYDGANWVASDDPNAIQNTIVDAKGDLITATGADVPARLAVGSDGDTLVADSAATTGLRWTENYAAGKNKIINGDFTINQRSFTSITGSGTGQYGFDRWKIESNDGSVTYTPQTFTLGTAPVTGYEGTNFARVVVASQTTSTAYSIFAQAIEDVRTFANQTVTISFWAKAASGTPKVAAEFVQVFGSGGSPSGQVTTAAGQSTITTSWARYTITANVPSISGKTIGTTANTSQLSLLLWTSAGSNFNSRTGSIGIQNNTIDIWGVQVEEGSVATAFQTATGTLQGELAACQRYYNTMVSGATNLMVGMGANYNTTQLYISVSFPVAMRIAPSLVATSGTDYYRFDRNDFFDTFNSVLIVYASNETAMLYNTTEISGTAGHAGIVRTNSASSSIAFSAEL